MANLKDLIVQGPTRAIGRIYAPNGLEGVADISIRLGTATVGGTSTPIYLDGGLPKPITGFSAATISTGTLSADRLATSGVTAGSYGPSANTSPAHGGTFSVPYVTVDNKGRVTAASTKTITLPAQYTHPSYTAAASGLYKVTVDATGHVSATTAVTKADITGLGIPGSDTNTTYSAGTGLSLSGTTFNHSNSVTAVTTAGLYKVKYDAQGHITGTTAIAKSDITGLGIPGSDTNTTYTIATGDANGQIKVTPSSGTAYNVDVKGLGSAAYTASTDYAATDHTHNYVPNTQAGVNAALNLLSEGSSVPVDNDYYISQYVNGGTSTTTYHRRPVSKLWDLFKTKISATNSGSGSVVTGVTQSNGAFTVSLGEPQVTVTNPTASTNYGVLFAADPNTTERNTLRKNNNFRFREAVGAANTEGFADIILGNATAKTADNNLSGSIILYGDGTYNTRIYPETGYTANRTIRIPNANGSMMLQKKQSSFWGIIDGDGSDTSWIRTPKSGIIPYGPDNDATNGNATNIGSATWHFKAAYVNDYVAKTVTADTLGTITGSTFLKGNDILGATADWAGLQVHGANDRFQIFAWNNRIIFRQNDNTDATVTDSNWNNWVAFITPGDISGSGGITVTPGTETIGSGDAAIPTPRTLSISHSNSVTAVTTAGLYKVKYDAQGHITGTTAVAKADITALGIPGSDTNTTYSAGSGLSLSGTTFNHSNSITAVTTAAFKKFKYDAQGHITGTADVAASDLPSHTHSYLPLTGGTVSGNINSKSSTYDATLANNGVTSTQYPTTFNLLDKNDNIMVRNEGVIGPDGTIGWYAYVRNYTTDGTMVNQKGIKFVMNKAGNLTYTVSDAAAFRTAIGDPQNSVLQSATTTTNYRPLLSGVTNKTTAQTGLDDTVTGQVYASNNFFVQPSTGKLFAKHLLAHDKDGGTVSLEFWRGSNRSHRIINESGALKFQTNYTADTSANWTRVTDGSYSTEVFNINVVNGTALSVITLNSFLRHVGYSSSWWNDRDNAVVQVTTAGSGYYPIIATKTKNSGSWGIGNHNDDTLVFNYISSTQYTAKTNPATLTQIKFNSTGSITAKSESNGFEIGGTAGRIIYYNGNGPQMYLTSSGNWAMGMSYYLNNTTTKKGFIGAYGNATAVDYFAIGPEYNNHTLKIFNNNTGLINIRGTTPQIQFTNTTTDKNYTAAGIWCDAVSTSGVNMYMQGGGNTIIGSGESPTNFKDANKVTTDNWTDGGENMYVLADGDLLFFSKCNTITDRTRMMFSTAGNLWIPTTGRYGWTSDANGFSSAIINPTLTATRTWTMPDKTGTVALVSDIPTYTGSSGISVSGTSITHSNSVTAVTTAGLYKVKYDAQGHITGTTAIAKSDITGLGIPGSDTTYGAEKGISLTSGKFGHSNTAVTAVTTASLKKVAYDAYGHITSTSNITKDDITGLGIPGSNTDEKVKQTADSTTTTAIPVLLKNASSSGTAADSKYNANVTVTPSTGTVTATKYNVNSKATMEYDSTLDALKFVFI